MNTDLLKELCEARGVPGQEDAIRAIVRRELEPIVDEMEVDSMGNLFATKRGKSDKVVMLAAHMDEIGFIIKHIDEKGFLRLQQLGGFDPRQLFAQRVMVNSKDGQTVPGVLCYATKPPHLLAGKTDSETQIEQFFVDVGLPAETVRETFQVGDMVTMFREFSPCGDTYISKCLDNRVGVFVMIEAVRKLAAEEEVTVVAVATTQEEIGLRGATTAAYRIQPDIGIALDTTIAADYPGGTPDAEVTALGKGAGIKIMDGSLLCHPKLVADFRSLAEENNISHQMEILPRGGTDGGALQRAAEGCPTLTLSIPTRYIHTVNEMVHKNDVEAAIDLLATFIQNCHDKDYSLV